MKEKTISIPVKVDLSNLMLQASKEMRCTGVSMGFAVASQYLIEIVDRAIELNDSILLRNLENLCYVKKGDKDD